MLDVVSCFFELLIFNELLNVEDEPLVDGSNIYCSSYVLESFGAFPKLSKQDAIVEQRLRMLGFALEGAEVVSRGVFVILQPMVAHAQVEAGVGRLSQQLQLAEQQNRLLIAARQVLAGCSRSQHIFVVTRQLLKQLQSLGIDC